MVVIDGKGKFLAPGLMDMHTHVSKPEQLVVNMAYGVTTIRVMWGNPETLELRAAVQAKRIPGPRIIAAGMLIDGEPPYWPGSLAMTGPAAADALVAEQRRDGYDFVKVYSRLTPEVFSAIAVAGKKHGIEVSGHVPQAIHLRQAMDAGLKTSEHFISVLWSVFADPNLPNPDVSPMFPETAEFLRSIGSGAIDVTTLVDPEKVAVLAAYAADQDHWFVPTHQIMRNFTDKPLPPFEDGVRFLTQEERLILKDGAISEFFGLTADQKKGESMLYTVRSEVLRAFYEAGAKIMVGTDQQTMVGLATVGEMKALRDVGMSNADVLRAATMELANYLGRSGELGELREGAVADLILIGGNPLQDLNALGHIFGVMTEGIWYDRLELDRMLEEVATKSAGGTH
ncbi:MAG: amidohydrolase family protein [Xanthomonadales bacterium]|nr:amidohydrolase family protein [Xanthomonadales bacterium]